MDKKLPIFYSALLLTGVNLLLRFASTGFQVYLSSRIGPSGIGLVQLVLSVGGLAMTASMAGIRTATMYLTAEQLGRKQPENVSWVLSGCIRYSLLCSVLVSSLLYFFAPGIAKYWIGDLATTSVVRLLICFLPTNCLSGVMIGYFTAANRIGTLAIVEIVEQTCTMLLTIVLLKGYASSNALKACSAVILGSGISGCLTLLCFLYLKRKDRLKQSKRIAIRKRLLQTAVPLALADDLKSGISTTENLMVPKRLGLYKGISEPLAAFGTVCGMVFPVLMFPAAILFGLAELLVPELARCAAAGSSQRINYLARRSIQIAMLYGFYFCGLLYLISDSLCIRLYKSIDAGMYLKIFSLLIPMLYCDSITDAMIKGLGQQTASVRYNIVTSSMDLVLLFILLPIWGMKGYFVSFAITHLLNFALSIRRLLKLTGNIVSIKTPILLILSMVVAIFVIQNVSKMWLQITLYTMMLGSLWYLLRIVRKEDILWIKVLIQRGRSD